MTAKFRHVNGDFDDLIHIVINTCSI